MWLRSYPDLKTIPKFHIFNGKSPERGRQRGGRYWLILRNKGRGLPFALAALTRCFRECAVWLPSPFLPALCVCPSDINKKLLGGRMCPPHFPPQPQHLREVGDQSQPGKFC